jgi:Abortive infection alpha
VGLLGGDWLKARRLENFARIAGKAQERLKARHVDAPEPPKLSILLPLIVAAADEEDDELQDMWARLLAAAADPARANLVRLAFVGIVKNMDPLDTLVLRELSTPPAQPANMVAHITSKFGMTPDDVIVSCLNLEELGCVDGAPGNPRLTFDARGERLRNASGTTPGAPLAGRLARPGNFNEPRDSIERVRLLVGAAGAPQVCPSRLPVNRYPAPRMFRISIPLPRPLTSLRRKLPIWVSMLRSYADSVRPRMRSVRNARDWAWPAPRMSSSRTRNSVPVKRTARHQPSLRGSRR